MIFMLTNQGLEWRRREGEEQFKRSLRVQSINEVEGVCGTAFFKLSRKLQTENHEIYMPAGANVHELYTEGLHI